MPPFDGRRESGPALRAGTASIITDASGIATVTHTHGFLPAGVIVQPELGSSWVGLAPYDHGSWTTTTFKVRAWVSGGTAYAGTLATVNYLIWQ